jgi:hypothetical protein
MCFNVSYRFQEIFWQFNFYWDFLGEKVGSQRIFNLFIHSFYFHFIDYNILFLSIFTFLCTHFRVCSITNAWLMLSTELYFRVITIMGSNNIFLFQNSKRQLHPCINSKLHISHVSTISSCYSQKYWEYLLPGHDTMLTVVNLSVIERKHYLQLQVEKVSQLEKLRLLILLDSCMNTCS